MRKSIQCWQCGTRMTLDALASNDGDCPECEVEIHLGEYLSEALDTNQRLEAELAALKAQGVVIPEPDFYLDNGATPCYYAETVSAALAASPVQQVSVPDVLREAIKWADHLCFECGALVQTRAPSVHVYNKTFEAVQAAKAMLAAAPSQPQSDAAMVPRELLYRIKNVYAAGLTMDSELDEIHALLEGEA